MTTEATPDAGALSFDAAVASLLPAEPVEQDAPEAQAPDAPAEEAEEPKGDDQTPEEAEAEPEEPAEGEETEAEAEAVEPVDPPKYWSKDAKEAFAKLPPDLQAVVLAQEGPREEAAAKAKAEAAAQVATAKADMEKVQQLAGQLSEFLPRATEVFASRWGSNPDWVAYAQEHGAEAMTLAKAQHDAELSDLQRLAAAKRQADQVAHEAFLRTELARLGELAPDLADPAEGPSRRRAVAEYLVKEGIPQDALPHMSAKEMVIARKAMLYDEAQAKLKAAPKPKPPAPAPKAPVRPAAAQSGTPAQRSANQVANRFAQTRSVDDAVALLLAKKA